MIPAKVSTRSAFAAMTDLSSFAFKVLTSSNPSDKVTFTDMAGKAWAANKNLGPSIAPPAMPSRPALPQIVAAGEMPSAKTAGVPSNIYYLHSLAHVELNAIDLCFDTLLRFPPSDLPDPFAWAADWISIACDEARHFATIAARLRELGSFYGALPAHGIIWQSATASAHCRRTRLALAQLVAEARGLDAGPRLAQRLLGGGDHASARLVTTIADEEIRHVQIGVKWFVEECDRHQLDCIAEFQRIALGAANFGAFAPPFNEERRRSAGLTPDWYLPVADSMQKERQRRREARSRPAQS